MSSTIAEAYVQLVPSFAGAKSQISSEMSDLGSSANKSFTKNFALGGAVAGAVSAVTSDIMSSISNLTSEAISASDATDKFKSTMDFAGISTKEIENVSKATRAYADATVYDLSTIQSTTAQLASNGVPNYEKLVEAAGNLNAVAGGNSDTFKSLGMVLTQTAGAGKLTTENWNQLSDAIPGASGVIQEALEKNGAFTGNFRDAMAEGQITSEEFNSALMELGTDPVAVEAAKSTDTFEGALASLQATIVGGLSDAFTSMKPMITDAISGLSEFIQGFSTWVKENPQLVQALAVGIGILAAAFIALSVAMWAASLTPISLIIAGIVIAIGLVIAAIVALVMNWDSIVQWVGSVWAGFVGWIGETWDAIAGFFVDTWNAIASFFTQAVTNVVNFVRDYWGLILSFFIGPLGLVIQWIVNNWDGIVSFFQATLATIGGFFSSVFTGIGETVRTIFENIVGFVKAPINTIIGLINGIIGRINGISIDIPEWAQGVFGGAKKLGFSLPRIPMLAEGGVVASPTIAMIGERGPEAVIPLNQYESLIRGEFGNRGNVVNYYAAPNQSIDAEQALFVAMKRAKIVAGW